MVFRGVPMVLLRRGVGLTCLLFALALGVEAQQVVGFTLPGMENRPYRWREMHPLTGTYSVIEEGQVGMEGDIRLSWPEDGRLHFLLLECGGVQWMLPMGGGDPGAAALAVPEKGGAPFSQRPGGVLWTGDDAEALWSPVAVSKFESLLSETRERLAPALQQAMLWGATSSDAKERVGGTVGAPIGEGPVGPVDMDSLCAVHTASFVGAADDLLDRCPGPVRAYLDVRRWEVLPELSPDTLARLRGEWTAMEAPDPCDAAAVTLFRIGIGRFAVYDALSEDALERLEAALLAGDLARLTEASAVFWGVPDHRKTMAWFLSEVGEGAWGCRPSRRFSPDRPLLEGVVDLLEHCAEDDLYGPSAQRLKQRFVTRSALPDQLRAFAGSGDLMAMEEVVGSGPALWLWVDAGAPSTLVQLQVLERMLADAQTNRRGSLSRDLTWVVVDAGMDWLAFERLVREVASRHGGLSRMPYTLLHSGGDIRWTEAFELRTLPAMRHHGPKLSPVREEPPLPGPALIDWLSRRS